MNLRKNIAIALATVVCVALVNGEIGNDHSLSHYPLVDMLTMIVNDREFLTLSEYDQLRILEAMYTMIDAHFKLMNKPEEPSTTTQRQTTTTMTTSTGYFTNIFTLSKTKNINS